MANVGLPFFSGFPGEFFGLVSLASESRFGVLCFFFGFYISAVYAFVSVSRLLYGSVRAASVGVYDLTVRSQQAFGLLGSLSVALGLMPNAVFTLAPLGATSVFMNYKTITTAPDKKNDYCYVDPSFNEFLDNKFGLARKPSELYGMQWGLKSLDYVPYTVYTLDPYASTKSSTLERFDGVLSGPDARPLNKMMETRSHDYNKDFKAAVGSTQAVLELSLIHI